MPKKYRYKVEMPKKAREKLNELSDKDYKKFNAWTISFCNWARDIGYVERDENWLWLLKENVKVLANAMKVGKAKKKKVRKHACENT